MMTSEDLIIPVYINEKIVLDMLAIMEDGFSMVSQINYSEHKDSSSEKQAGIGLSTSATILSKLLKIDFNSGISHTGANGESESITKEKVHTNVSLLFKFRNYLKEKVLGKVIAVCADQSGSIDLLRKTSLSILSESILNEMFSGMKSDEIQQFNLPELKTKIAGPAAIVIPVAIYA